MGKITILACLQLLWLVAPAQERQWFSEADITGLNPPAELVARHNAVSFVIGDTAYVGTGDRGGNGRSVLKDFWKYTPASNTWTKINDFPGEGRSDAVAFVIDGKGYVGTGKSSGQEIFRDFYKYDPATGQWQQVANFEGGERRSAIAFTIDGKGYVGTGCNTDDCARNSEQNDLWEYDPIANDWSQKASMPGPRFSAVAFAINGKGYIASGTGSNSNNIQQYDPVLNSYQQGGAYPLFYSRRESIAFVVDDKAYIGLGTQENNFLIFDPKIHMENLPTLDPDGNENKFGAAEEDNRWGTISFVIKGKAYVGLGTYTDGTSTQKQDLWSFQSPVPDTPEDLTVVAASLDSALLHWTDYANNEKNFRVERSEDGLTFTSVGNADANHTQYNDKSVAVDREYYYRVRANADTVAHHSAFSNTVVVNTFVPPSNLSANVVSPSEITLQWQDNSTGEQGFVIERKADGASFVVLDTVEAITFSDATVRPGTDYTYRVSALATVSRSATSNTVTAGSLVTPTQLLIEAATDSTIAISWAYEGSNAAWYRIERRESGGTFVLIDSVDATASRKFQDGPLDEGATYEYRIKAVNRPRSSVYSESLSASSQLKSPATVTASLEDTEVIVTWEDQSMQETHYVVRRSDPNSGELLLLDSVSTDKTTYTDVTVTQNGQYVYYVQAVGDGVASDTVASDTLTITALAPTVTGIDDPAFENPVKVYPNPGDGLINVFVGDERTAYVAVFNSQGRLVQEVQQAEQAAQPTMTVDIHYFPTGIYTLRIYTARGVSVKKVAKQ